MNQWKATLLKVIPWICWLGIIAALSALSKGDEASDLRTHVEFLSSDSRVAGTAGMEKAIEYVSNECKALGLTVYKQPVKVNKGTCKNVIATIGVGNPRIVVGAHLDAQDGRGRDVYNGADDNASGCSVLLALAKRLRGGVSGVTLEFHFYTGEEEGLKGSQTVTKSPIVEIDKYRFMLNLDMVGRLGDRLPRGDAFEFADVFAHLFQKYEFAERITWCEDTGDSDHASWWKAGVPAVILHTGLHDDYHKPTDDADKIDYDGMIGVLNYADDIVRGIAGKLIPPNYKLH